jgi:hypothetical protein
MPPPTTANAHGQSMFINRAPASRSSSPADRNCITGQPISSAPPGARATKHPARWLGGRGTRKTSRPGASRTVTPGGRSAMGAIPAVRNAATPASTPQPTPQCAPLQSRRHGFHGFYMLQQAAITSTGLPTRGCGGARSKATIGRPNPGMTNRVAYTNEMHLTVADRLARTGKRGIIALMKAKFHFACSTNSPTR